MANYPPDNEGVTTKLRSACNDIVGLESVNDPLGAIRLLLHRYATDSPQCFDMNTQVPAGRNGTISGGDWSGCGAGKNGESWDFQTCTFLVEQIGTNGYVRDGASCYLCSLSLCAPKAPENRKKNKLN